VHWNQGGGDIPYPDCILCNGLEASLDDYASAQVFRAILDVAGLAFDPDGRLLSLPTNAAGNIAKEASHG
jgi:hypothetical protein